MKSPLLWMAGCLLAAFVAKAQFVTQAYTREFTFGTAEPRIVKFVQIVFDLSSERSTTKRVICGVLTSSKEDAIVRLNSTIIAFPEGAEIGTNAPVHPKNPGVNTVGIDVLQFIWELRQPGDVIYQSSVLDPFKGQNDVMIGFRLGKVDQARFGWMRLHRVSTVIKPRPNRLSELATPFTVTDVALNPFPGRPIRAGLPPELPTLQATHRLDTPDGPKLRVQWPDGFAGVRLQRTTNLDTPIAWEELAAASNDVLLPAPEEGAVYFRLVYDF